MKHALAVVCASLFVLPLAAQQSPTQPVTIQMQCRDMATTGNYLAPGEMMISNKACHAVSVQRVDSAVTVSNAQPAPQTPGTTSAPPTGQQYASSVLPTVAADENPIRVVLMDSASWETRGWSAKTDSNSTAAAVPAPTASGNDATNAQQLRDDLVSGFNHQCPQAIVTSNLETATFAVTLDREKKNRFSEHDTVVAYNRAGDHIFTASSKSLSDPLQGACQAIVTAAKR